MNISLLLFRGLFVNHKVPAVVLLLGRLWLRLFLLLPLLNLLRLLFLLLFGGWFGFGLLYRFDFFGLWLHFDLGSWFLFWLLWLFSRLNRFCLNFFCFNCFCLVGSLRGSESYRFILWRLLWFHRRFLLFSRWFWHLFDLGLRFNFWLGHFNDSGSL